LKRRNPERGVTLLEMLIAVSLVAILSTAMLMALRTSVQTYEKTDKRLESNRRTVGSAQLLFNQVSAAMPVTALCSVNGGPPASVSFLSGDASHLRLVSSYSIVEGARGSPQIVEYSVLPGENGTVRLVVGELPYTGPQSTTAACAGVSPSASYVLADRLAYCRFLYHEPYDLNGFVETPWLPVWDRPFLPAAIRIDMKAAAAAAGGLPDLGVTVPLHVTRDPFTQYEDHF
jgi:prepilin-type N-terminal cleavage/methylation domain-containing protein